MKKIIVAIIVAMLFTIPFIFKKEEIVQKKQCELVITVEGAQLPLEEYVLGVVAGEMPAAYDIEALKAQAIAARTYAIYKMNSGQSELQATVAHQVFHDKQQRAEKWKDESDQYEQKLQQAVKETAGKIVTYNGEAISAMFHAASNGKTESARNYSGNNIAYLQSVSSPEKEIESVSVSFQQLGVKNLNELEIVRNDSGRVDYVQLADERWTGREFRELLSLRSTDFTLTQKQGQIVVTTSGYGHGVGMSQRGAQEYALKGKKAEEILLHYYSGTKIEPIICENLKFND